MPSRSASLRSPSPRAPRPKAIKRPEPCPGPDDFRPGPSPIQIVLACFLLTRPAPVFELPVVELVVALLDGFKDLGHTVVNAWRSLEVLESTRVIDLLPGEVDVAEEAFCPEREGTRALLATARLRLPLDEAQRRLAEVAARGRLPKAPVKRPAREAVANDNGVTEDERDFCPVALSLAA